MDITVVTLVEEQMSPWKGNLPRTSLIRDLLPLMVIEEEGDEVSREGARLGEEGVVMRIVDLTGDEDLTDEDGDIGMGDSTGVSASLGGEIFSGGKKSWESTSVEVQ
ncbi:hypothetical protein Tco_1165814 [Tanacetum coccineum]